MNTLAPGSVLNSALDSGLDVALRLALLPQAKSTQLLAGTGLQPVSPTALSPALSSLSPEALAIAPQLTHTVIAQQFDQDFIGDAGTILNNFVESGQIWALLIGVVLGYLLRGLTAY